MRKKNTIFSWIFIWVGKNTIPKYVKINVRNHIKLLSLISAYGLHAYEDKFTWLQA